MSNKRTKAKIAAQVLEAYSRGQVFSASVKKGLIEALIAVGEFIKYRKYFDTATTSDSQALTSEKYLTEALTSLDQIASTITRSLTDTTASDDTERVLSATKVLADAIAATDLITITRASVFLENISAIDDSYYTTTKGLSESLLHAEELLFSVEVNQSEDLTASDPAEISTDKLADGEYLAALDAYSPEYIKYIDDVIITSDDYLGDLNVDDDQYAIFTKRLNEPVVTTETFERTIDYGREFGDYHLVNDEASIASDKPIEDSIAASDSTDIQPTKVPSDTAFTLDEINYLQTDADKYEALSGVDDQSITSTKNLSDTPSTNDVGSAFKPTYDLSGGYFAVLERYCGEETTFT